VSSQPAINGRVFGHASITANIDGETYVGIASINYGSEREIAGAFGTSPQQVGTVLGNVTHTGDFEVYKKEGQRLRARLGNGYLGKVFSFTVTYRETSESELITDEVTACIKKDDTSSSTGGDPVKDKFELHVSRVVRNGVLCVEEET
jgi:hypothetical protein